MNNFLTGKRVTTKDGPGEVLTVFGDKVVIKLDTGATTTLANYDVEVEHIDTTVTDLNNEPPAQAEARAEHAGEIVARLDHANQNQHNDNLINKQTPMEISEKAMDVINDLIEINNDRVEGFEKAARDLEDQDTGLETVFNKLANESRENSAELTELAQLNGEAPVEGTSTSGALHRAWLDVKAVFTGGDAEAILNECERGEDAIKAAYRLALDPDNEIGYELHDVLQRQQMGIVAGHDLIKSLRDEVETIDDQLDDDDENDVNDTTGTNPVYQNEVIVAKPSFESAVGEYQSSATYAPEPESIEQEEDWEEEQVTSSANSKLMDFFVEELKDLLWAERELVETLPEMAEAATSQELRTAFTNHLAETEVHVTRLEQIFGILGLEPDTTKCDAMAGIIEEGDGIISFTEEGTAQRDVGLIFAGQKAEHYEIASYGGMISLAKTLGYYDIAEILVLTIDEEKTADALLTEIAENHVNYEASTEASEN